MGRIIKHSIMAGFMVGIGVVINSLSTDKCIGAFLFSLALLTVVACQLKLYTGQIGFISIVPIKDLIVMFFGNILGVILPVFIIASQRPEFKVTITEIAQTKFSNSITSLFLYGVLCGVLMFVAVYSKNQLITVMCIMTFILSGYDHCIADFPFLIANFNSDNLIKFISIIMGNSLGSILTYKLVK